MDLMHWRQINHSHCPLKGQVLLAWASFRLESEFDFVDILSEQEKNRAARLLNRTSAAQQIIARGILRKVIEKMFDINPGALKFEKDSHNKPYLIFPMGTRINFNLSHSGDYLLIAFGHDCHLGVDIEQVDKNRDFLAIASLVFSPAEQIYLRNSLNPVRDFYSIWTMKEAVLKASGHGFSFPPQKLTIRTRNGVAESMNLPAEFGGFNSLELTNFTPEKNYFAAVAVLNS